jgi:hypothetical protein
VDLRVLAGVDPNHLETVSTDIPEPNACSGRPKLRGANPFDDALYLTTLNVPAKLSNEAVKCCECDATRQSDHNM